MKNGPLLKLNGLPLPSVIVSTNDKLVKIVLPVFSIDISNKIISPVSIKSSLLFSIDATLVTSSDGTSCR